MTKLFCSVKNGFYWRLAQKRQVATEVMFKMFSAPLSPRVANYIHNTIKIV